MICRRNPKEKAALASVAGSYRPAYSSVSGNWYSGSSCDEAAKAVRPFETADAAEGKNSGYRFGDFLLAVDGGALHFRRKRGLPRNALIRRGF